MLYVARGQGLAQGDGLRRLSYEAAVHDHIGAGRKVQRCELMFGGYTRNQRIALARKFDLLSWFEVGERNQYVVPGIELQDLVGHISIVKQAYSRCLFAESCFSFHMPTRIVIAEARLYRAGICCFAASTKQILRR